MDCLNRAWAPLVPRADVVFVPARLAPLGTEYCDRADDVTHRGAFYSLHGFSVCLDPHTFAHEYGHHLQGITGILTSYDFGVLHISTGDLDRNRRMELQASCFAVLFMGVHKAALGLRGNRLRVFDEFVDTTGDENAPKLPPDHGSRKSHGYWSHRGFRSPSPAVCNTFTAPPAKVS